MDLDAVWRLLKSSGANACIKQWRKPPVPSKVLRELYETYWHEAAAREFLLNYPFIPSDLLDVLLNDADLETPEILALINHPRLGQEAFSRLAEHPEPKVRAGCAAQKRLAQRLLHRLTDDPSSEVRAAAAASSNLKIHWQAVLCDDPELEVRQALAENSNLEQDIALLLSVDSSAVIRAATAMSATVEEGVLAAWLAGDDAVLATAVLERKDLDSKLATAAAVSPFANIRAAAFVLWPDHPAIQAAIALHGSEEERIQLANTEKLSIECLNFLAKDVSDAVVKAIIRRPELPEKTILELFQHKPNLRSLLVLHPRISNETLIQWCAQATPELRTFLIYRPDLPDAVLEDWVNHKGYLEVLGHLGMGGAELPDLDPEIANQLACHVLPSVRRMAATADKISPSLLRKLASDPSPEVRKTAAAHAFMPTMELDELTRDEDETVAETAKSTWRKRQTQRHQEFPTEPKTPSVRGVSLNENMRVKKPAEKSLLKKLRSILAVQD
ncbi:MAG: hypothetical protein LR015_01085 [Verrucomicrobia bacterium]|nr:hypothetical protein [Verrucomicrobiota bacterium]